MSSAKPADVPVRWIERIWSVYDVKGESIKLYLIWSVLGKVGLFSMGSNGQNGSEDAN